VDFAILISYYGWELYLWVYQSVKGYKDYFFLKKDIFRLFLDQNYVTYDIIKLKSKPKEDGQPNHDDYVNKLKNTKK